MQEGTRCGSAVAGALGILSVVLVASCGGDDSGSSGTIDESDSGALEAGPGAEGGLGDSGGVDSAPPPVPAPPTTGLESSSPPNGASNVPRTEWFRLGFAAGLDPDAARGIVLDCGPSTPPIDADVVGGTLVVVNPRAPLPAGATCELSWTGPNGSETLSFTLAGEGAPAPVPYDRDDMSRLAPFPDDYFLEPDAAAVTGYRAVLPVPTVSTSLSGLLGAVIESASGIDGFSPLAPLVVELPDAVDPATIPRTTVESLDPFATVALFDLDPSSESYLARLPFFALVRDEANAPMVGVPTAHNLIVFPAEPLRDRGRYALVVTNRALVDPTRPLEPSSFFRIASDPSARTTAAELDAGAVIDTVFEALAGASPPLRIDDAALALRFSVRSVDDIPSDLLAVRSAVGAMAPPSFDITSIEADTDTTSQVAAFVRGTWHAPNFSTDGNFMNRDTAGQPVSAGTTPIPFILALPDAALTGSVPVMIYQHGQPGNAEDEVPRHARRDIAPLGVALIGFTDMANREIIPTGDVLQLNTLALTTLLTDRALPDYLSLLSVAEQVAFLRLIPALASLDALPIGAADGQPELNPAAPLTYLGISQGSTHGIGFVSYAPEIRAAALVVGAGRFTGLIIHQTSEALYGGVTAFFPDLDRAMFYTGLAIAQMGFDPQDTLNHARYLYREPHDLGVASRASVLLVEGLGDSLIPPYNTQAGAAALGIPHLEPVQLLTPFLQVTSTPVEANIDANTTAALFQYVPQGFAGVTATPGCATLAETEGHYCPQSAAEARAQRVEFFRTALMGVPRIIDPL